ncbi:MAG: polyprenyl synthetase family protein [Polyangiales bacterium]
MRSRDEGMPYLDACRDRVLREIRATARAATAGDDRAYDLLLDYPLRRAKGLRPAICIAVCRALGGDLDEVLPSASALELFHNAFLLHDDVEDGSLERRGAPALHHTHGVPQAINCGDGLLALSLRPLLANTERLGLGRALRVLELCAAMVTASFEGQATELRWIADGAWDLSDADYEAMVVGKTCGYSFVTPARVGAAVARAGADVDASLTRFFRSLGLAFQIQDDVLNLETDRGAYGKEFAGDLWEGKRTLMLLRALRHATDDDRARALRTLKKPRPSSLSPASTLATIVDDLAHRGVLSAEGARAVRAELAARDDAEGAKTPDDVRHLLGLIEAHDGLGHARRVAARHARDADAAWEDLSPHLGDNPHVRFLRWLRDYVTQREW